MTQLTENVFAVEVPEGAAGFEIDNPLSPGDLVYYLGFPSVFNFRKVSLPPGSWKFICTTRTCTPEQAREITGEPLYPSIALAGMCKAKGLDGSKNYVLLKKG